MEVLDTGFFGWLTLNNISALAITVLDRGKINSGYSLRVSNINLSHILHSEIDSLSSKTTGAITMFPLSTFISNNVGQFFAFGYLANCDYIAECQKKKCVLERCS